MPFEARVVLGLLLSLGAVYTLTPLAIRAAGRFNFYDKPAGYKGHARPTPYLGGTAVVAGFTLALLLAAAGDAGRTATLLGGMVILLVVGTIDDRINVSPLLRVAVEIAIGTGVWAAGMGWDIGAGSGLDLALTIVWIVGVVNALNLFDNMDGAASTMAAVAAAIVAVLGITHDDHWLAITSAALCGTCLGFLPHNLASPARIFLGDGGSMPLGFAVATLVMVGSSEAAPAGQALLLGLLLVGVPAADTFMVILSRRRRRVGVLTGGRDHLTHRSRQWLRTARAVAMGLGAIQALVSVIAVFAIRGGSAWFLVILVLYLVTAATAIAFLEARYEESVDAASAASPPAPATFMSPARPALWAAAAFGVAVGLTPFLDGLYSEGKWIPVGLLLLIGTTVGAIARPVSVSRPQALLVIALVGLGVTGLVSATWAPSIAQATSDGNRWLMLAALCASAIVLLRSDRAGRWLAAGLAAGVAVVGAYVLVVLLGNNSADVLLGGRLHEPLGYVNAQATTFLMGYWLWFATVEHRSRLVASTGLGVATMMAGLVLMTQSRGAALAMAASVVLVAALPGQRMRRVFAMLCTALGVLVAGGPLLDVYRTRGLTSDCQEAALALVGVSLGVAALWWVGSAFLARLEPERRALMPRLGAITLAVLASAVVGTAVVKQDAVGRYVDQQWTAFVKLEDTSGGTPGAGTTRLASGAGYRYDYWRVAWNAFRDRPVNGFGAGNYDRPYFQARATAEAIRQPHSLILQELSELGVLGGVLVIMLAAGLVWGLARLWRSLAAGVAAPAGIAAAGALTAWFVHTNVDWIHLVPGVTGIALAMAAVLLRTPARDGPRADPVATTDRGRYERRGATVIVVAASIVLVVAAASLSRSGLATFFRDRGRDALADNPAKAVMEADRSLRLDAENPRTYYVKAAALSRFNDAEGARRALEQALAKEPDNFVTWTLLGDLAVRLGDFAAAKDYYEHALRFNPGDPTLQGLAGDPSSAAPAP